MSLADRPRRFLALVRKESVQVWRDPSSLMIAFALPVMLLFLFGYALSLDTKTTRIGLVVEETSPDAADLASAFRASRYFDVTEARDRRAFEAGLILGDVHGIVVIPANFAADRAARRTLAVQVLVDGSEPNTANFIQNYVTATVQNWEKARALETGMAAAPITANARFWFNAELLSRNFLVPGSIAIVMTLVGTLLTSLVVAREWERGTMEALLASPVTRLELLLSKILPYYLLGMAACWICLLVAVYIMGVPFRGSLLMLFVVSSLFLGCALGMGLFLSTVMRSQFNAAQAALIAAFLPAVMLSGFVFEIASMPPWLRAITHLIPARYFASSLQTLYQAGSVFSILLVNGFCLLLLAGFWLALTARKTRRTLE